MSLDIFDSFLGSNAVNHVKKIHSKLIVEGSRKPPKKKDLKSHKKVALPHIPLIYNCF